MKLSLCFWIWYDIESNWDYFYVQVSDDGGCMYENLANDFTTNYDPYNQNVGNGITGASGGWVEAKF
ncbi:MAG: immune inhibitor A, partial [candidate division Zixibacteria bacterium]|nr:immune inhibitor A [candidate division Zixibacteria bacterium]